METGLWPSWVLPDPRESPSNFLSKPYHHIHQNPQSRTDLASPIFLLYPSKPAIYNRLRWVLFFFFNPFLQLTTERKKKKNVTQLSGMWVNSLTQLGSGQVQVWFRYFWQWVSQFLFLEFSRINLCVSISNPRFSLYHIMESRWEYICIMHVAIWFQNGRINQSQKLYFKIYCESACAPMNSCNFFTVLASTSRKCCFCYML